MSYEDLLAGRVPDGAIPALARYAAILERWSERHNLVSFGSREELVNRHIVDALAAAPLLGERGRLLDIGSGAGLPGVPLLVVRQRWSGVLLEPRQKRWAFLRMVVRELGLAADVHTTRYQEYSADEPFDVITARAVGSHEELLSWARDRLAPAGAVFLWTTERGVSDLAAVAGWHVLSSPLPGLERGRLAQLQPCFT